MAFVKCMNDLSDILFALLAAIQDLVESVLKRPRNLTSN
ncbi:hypothetical protein ACVWYG_000843 [Pedobacter sp. UYEF25]